jgi:hypothetical protein
MSHQFAHVHSVANLEDSPATSVENGQKRMADDTEPEGNDTLETDPKPKEGHLEDMSAALAAKKRKHTVNDTEPSANVKFTIVVPPKSAHAEYQDPKPIRVRGKILPPRSPQPA